MPDRPPDASADRPSDRPAERPTTVLREAEERLQVRTRERETGRVRLRRHVEAHDETVAVALAKEQADVQRVPVGTFVDEAPEIRREGDVLVVPVVEEVLVVETRLRLVEEVHVTLTRTEQTHTETHPLRRARVEVERLAPDATRPSGEPRPSDDPRPPEDGAAF